MPQEGQNYEATILQKLEAMEDFLKSFISSFEELLEEKAERFESVYAPVSGQIIWHKWSGPVEKDEPIFVIRYGTFLVWTVKSPAAGTLELLVGLGGVSREMLIARIWLKEIRI